MTTPDLHATLPWLVADIGGTNARLGWVDASDHTRVQHVRTLPVAGHATPQAALRSYLDELAGQLGASFRPPRWMALAVATAITGDEVAFTNSPWRFSRTQLQSDFALQGLLVLNDFEALALSLPRLAPAQLHPRSMAMGAQGTLAVIGPGTGLGVGGVVPSPAGWVALPGEGGHVTLPAYDALEAEVIAAVRRTHAHVSAERLLAGPGLPLLHQALAQVKGQAAAPLTPAELVERGLARSDALCDQTLDLFCNFLGGLAGNLALTLGARGGVYIGGGVVPRLGERFFDSGFRERFEAKGRFAPYLQAVPTAVITDTLVALQGAALAIEQQALR
jgi:glucokinase